MEQNKIDRINQLYKKQKNEGLTEDEKTEQAILRQEYLGLVKKNIANSLDSIKVQEADGSIRPLKNKKDFQ